MMKYQSHKFLLSLAVSSMILVAVVYGFMNKIVDTSAKDVIEMRSRITYTDQTRTQSRVLTALFNNTVQDRDKLRSAVLPDDKVVDLIDAVESLSKKTGAKVSIANIDSTNLNKNSTTTGMISMNVMSTGSWTSVMRTMYLAENLPFVAVIENVRLDSLQKHNWNLNFKLKVLTI